MKKKGKSILDKNKGGIQRPFRVLVSISIDERKRLLEIRRSEDEPLANAARRLMFEINK